MLKFLQRTSAYDPSVIKVLFATAQYSYDLIVLSHILIVHKELDKCNF